MTYKLLDSGEGEKLEQFGSMILIRPCKTAVWSKQHAALWEQVDAQYIPGRGWTIGAEETEWTVEIGKIGLNLRLQSNGQVGLFPEHIDYLQPCLAKLTETSRVLNLFAYTGYATAACVAQGAHVTHVDLSKTCLSWAKRNIEHNGFSAQLLRLLSEDAVKFSSKEVERGTRYDLIIADPPNFSRISKSKQWNIDDILSHLIKSLSALLSPQGTLIVTSHRPEYCNGVLHNLLLEALPKSYTTEHHPLFVPHAHDQRLLPAGFFAKSEPLV
jgi:23S rRNA (cytosine1962-C5)-methyltransferase